jgi:hypothetical protein
VAAKDDNERESHAESVKARRRREAEALRANLRRRKEQARARADDGGRMPERPPADDEG